MFPDEDVGELFQRLLLGFGGEQGGVFVVFGLGLSLIPGGEEMEVEMEGEMGICIIKH